MAEYMNIFFYSTAVLFGPQGRFVRHSLSIERNISILFKFIKNFNFKIIKYMFHINVITLFLLFANCTLVYGSEEFIVIGAGVYLHEKPSYNSKRIGKVKFGDILYCQTETDVFKDSNNNIWYNIFNRNIHDKWMHSKYLYPYIPENKNSIYLKISEEKFKNSNNNFGDLVEIKGFIDDILFTIDDIKIIKKAEELRNDILQRSIEIIPKNKKDVSPYKEWIQKNDYDTFKNLALNEIHQTTLGNKCPIISNIEGGVNIIYGDTNDKKIRITYYRLKGVSADFLVNGLLSPEWEKILGGQQDIMNNNVLHNTRKILRMFSMEPFGVAMYISGNNGNYFRLKGYLYEYAKKLKDNIFETKNEKWNVHLEGRKDYLIEYPNIQDINDIIYTEKWPQGYHLFYSCFQNDFDEEEYSYPIVWKYLTRHDIDNYDKYIIKYLDYIAKNENIGEILTNKEYNGKIIKSLKYLTKNNFPKDFIIIYGEEGFHGGWDLVFKPREIEIEIAAIENISTHAIEISTLNYSEINDFHLMPYDTISQKLSKEKVKSIQISNAGILAVNEKIVIPLRLSFVNNFKALKCKHPIPNVKNIENSATSATDKTIKLTGEIYKKFEVMMDNTYPAMTERYNFGYSWMLHSLIVDGISSKIRQANFNQFTLHLSNLKGSCPFIYTKSTEADLWKSQGHMLLGATSIEKMKEDVLKLSDFTGILKIAENEDEISFIKNIYIEEILENNQRIIHHPNNSLNNFEVIRGYPKVLEFDTINPENNSTFYLYMKGYYIPFSHIKFHEEFILDKE